MSFLIVIDSKHTQSVFKNSIADVNVHMNNFSNTDLSGYSVAIESIILPNLVYPVNRYNNVITFNEALDAGTIYTATLTEGNYTAAELAVEIETQMTTAGGNTYTVIYNSKTSNFVVSVPLPNNFRFAWESTSASSNYIMGFDTADSSFQAAKTSVYPVRLDGTLFVDIVTNFQTDTLSTDGRSSIMYRLPISQGFGNIIYYNNLNMRDSSIYVMSDDLYNLRLRFVDQDGNIWPLPENAEWSICLRCWPTQ